MPNPKKHYLILACIHCRRLILASSDKRTRSCAYCGRRVRIEDARVVAESEDARQARELLREAKAKAER